MKANHSNIKDEKDAAGQEDTSKAPVKSEDLVLEQNSEGSDVEFVSVSLLPKFRHRRDHQRNGAAFLNVKEEKDATRQGDMSKALVKTEQNSEREDDGFVSSISGLPKFRDRNVKEEKDATKQGDMSKALVKTEQNSESQDDDFVSSGGLPVFHDLYDRPIDAATFVDIKDEKDAAGQEDASQAPVKSEVLVPEQNSEDSDVEFVSVLPKFRHRRDHQRNGAAFLNIKEENDAPTVKFEDLMVEQSSESEDDEFVTISGLPVFKDLHDQLYDHQRGGAEFLYSLYRGGRKGGILADDMGLGKTIQVIAFLSGMYDAGLVKHTLIVMPLSLIPTWTKELTQWTPGIRVKEFRCETIEERFRNLKMIQKQGGVMLTTYQMLARSWQQLASYNGQKFKWDYIILDEAHKIKNTSTKTARSAYAIPAENRVLLTGTPVQNNLREMWALFDFACQGTLLGTYRTFKKMYQRPIMRGREKDATPKQKALGLRISENLITIIRPYFLRRTKAEVQMNAKKTRGERLHSNDSKVTNTQTYTGTAVMPTLTRKNDLIVWTYLSAIQEDIYHQFVSLDTVQELLNSNKSPLTALIVLKKLCDSPRLLPSKAISQMDLKELTSKNQQDDDDEFGSSSIDHIPDETLISESGKMVFLIQLLEQLREEGHRTLIFAGFLKVLDIIQQVLGNRGFKVLRLDGKITKSAERARLISLFQEDSSYSVFLLTTQVGGVGITLTGANRVVIFDPSWNPATDSQAVDRVYRIGQTENVVIYRLITCGTVEEKIYRRQVFKDSLTRQTTGDKKNPFRYFSKEELRELFILEDPRSSNTQLLLQSLHSKHRRTDPKLDKHIMHLHSMEIFGISDHDLMFSQANDHDEDLDDKESWHYIQSKVQKAQELMKAESEMHAQLGSSAEQDWLRQVGQDSHEGLFPNKKSRNSPPSPQASEFQDYIRDSPAVAAMLEQPAVVKKKRDGSQSQRMQVIDLTLDEDVLAKQAVGIDQEEQLSEIEHDSPRNVSFRSVPVKKLSGYGKNHQAEAPGEGVTENQVVDLTEGVAENQAVNLDEGVAENQAVDLDKGVAENQAVDLDEGVSENQAVNLDEGVAENQAVDLDEGVAENQAVDLDEGVSENQAVDLDEGVAENQAVAPDEGVSENQAVVPDKGVAENQGQAVDLDVGEGVAENQKKRKAAVLCESTEEEDDHMPTSNHFVHSSPSSHYYAVLNPLYSTPIRSRMSCGGDTSLEAMRDSTSSFFKTWKTITEEENNNNVENYSD